MLALAVSLIPPLAEVTGPALFVFGPSAAPVTSTLTVHVEVAAIIAPPKETVEPPGGAAILPPHVLLAPFGVATRIPTGRLSVTPTSVSATLAFGFVIASLKVVTESKGIALAPKDLVSVGGDASENSNVPS